jgi:PAS domain S-box-containing protein
LNDWPRFKASSAGFHVYDGAVAKADNLIFDITPVHQYEENSPYYYAYPLQFNDRTWLIAFNENPPHQVSYYAAWVVLVSGLVLSGLLFILMQFIIRTQQLAKNIADNLTRRYQHQNQALKESESRWRFAIEEAGDGLWDWNIADNTLFVSKRWKAMLGYTDDEIAEGISANGIDQWETRIHPDDKAHTLVALQACLDQKTDIYTSQFLKWGLIGCLPKSCIFVFLGKATGDNKLSAFVSKFLKFGYKGFVYKLIGWYHQKRIFRKISILFHKIYRNLQRT